MKKTLMIASTVALMAIGSSTQAQIITTYFTQGNGNNPALQVISDVTYSGGIFTYDYAFQVGTLTGGSFSSLNASTLYPNNPVQSFTIGLVLPTSTIFAISGGGLAAAIPDTVNWTFGAGVWSGNVSFQSIYGPGRGDGSANDHVSWDANNPGSLGGPLVPVIPEPTTVLAGALMLLPLGVGAFRSIRKDRAA